MNVKDLYREYLFYYNNFVISRFLWSVITIWRDYLFMCYSQYCRVMRRLHVNEVLGCYTVPYTEVGVVLTGLLWPRVAGEVGELVENDINSSRTVTPCLITLYMEDSVLDSHQGKTRTRPSENKKRNVCINNMIIWPVFLFLLGWLICQRLFYIYLQKTIYTHTTWSVMTKLICTNKSFQLQ